MLCFAEPCKPGPAITCIVLYISEIRTLVSCNALQNTANQTVGNMQYSASSANPDYIVRNI
jgi:hypothetical protein